MSPVAHNVWTMTEVTYVGGPLDGTVRKLLDGEITSHAIVPDGAMEVLYEEDGIDTDGRIRMRVTETRPLGEFFPPKLTIAKRGSLAAVAVHDLYGALLRVNDRDGNELATFQLGNEETDLLTMDDALRRVPTVLSERAGLQLASDWDTDGQVYYANVRPL